MMDSLQSRARCSSTRWTMCLFVVFTLAACTESSLILCKLRHWNSLMLSKSVGQTLESVCVQKFHTLSRYKVAGQRGVCASVEDTGLIRLVSLVSSFCSELSLVKK